MTKLAIMLCALTLMSTAAVKAEETAVEEVKAEETETAEEKADDTVSEKEAE